ncbi:MAG: hypothetical protein J5I50_09255 [Chitinophagaceae bacterium]|nr:hypothetical protein [Chitinophagaceae bacterium]
MANYFIFSISIAFISWIVGLIATALIRNTRFYKERLSNLNFIKSEAVNKALGVGVIKWITQNTFFKIFNPKLAIKKKFTKEDFITLRDEMTVAEVGHLIGFCFVTVFAIVYLFKGKYTLALIIIIVNIIMNLYPSLLQQMNKRRIDRVLKRFPA